MIYAGTASQVSKTPDSGHIAVAPLSPPLLLCRIPVGTAWFHSGTERKNSSKDGPPFRQHWSIQCDLWGTYWAKIDIMAADEEGANDGLLSCKIRPGLFPLSKQHNSSFRGAKRMLSKTIFKPTAWTHNLFPLFVLSFRRFFTVIPFYVRNVLYSPFISNSFSILFLKQT